MKRDKAEALRYAIFLSGSRAKFARAMGVTVACVGLWVKNGLPAIRVGQVYKLTKGELTINELLGLD